MSFPSVPRPSLLPDKPRLWGCAALSALALLGATTAQAAQTNDFVGYYSTNGGSFTAVSHACSATTADGNWDPQCTYTGETADVSTPNNSTLVITAPGGSIGGPSSFDYVVTAPSDGTWSFNWQFDWYVDGNGNQTENEEAGYYVNGVRTPLAFSSDIDGVFVVTNTISGLGIDIGTLTLAAGDVFGFYLYGASTDSHPATLTITGFNAPDVASSAVPEPATLSLFAWGAGCFLARRQRPRSSANPNA